MPQVTFEPLPIFQRGEGLEVDDNLNEGITVNYVDADNSWTLVQRRKKNQIKRHAQDEKWNKQQKENFLRFGDIYQSESYKSYRNVDVEPPVANIPQQQPVVQPAVVQPPIPAPAQPQPAAVLAPQPPQGVVAPPPNQLAQGGQLKPKLEAIPEEDEEEQDDEIQPQGAGYRSRSSSSASSSDTLTPEKYETPLDTPEGRQGSPFGPKGEALLDNL
jgi:hypothetical protein